MSDLFGNRIVGFPTRRLICHVLVNILICMGWEYDVTLVLRKSVFKIFNQVGLKKIGQGSGNVLQVKQWNTIY